MTRVAAVDIGTNSCRLLIAEIDGDSRLLTLDRRLRITRLGEGVDGNGVLAPAAIQRVLDAVTTYRSVWQEAGVTEVGIVATSATRDAANGAALIEGLTAATGVMPRVLSGIKEARLSFSGATAWRSEPGLVAVVDIGGGSTEVILGQREPVAATSRQIGSVRLTERILTDDPATPAQIAEARRVVDAELDVVETLVQPGRAGVLVGVAGTATTLAALHAGLTVYAEGAVHGTTISRTALAQLTDQLLAMTAGQIAASGPVQPGREDVLAAGALILDRIVQRFGFADVLVSESDILDGLAMEVATAAGRARDELVEVVAEDGTMLEVITRGELRRRPQARHRCTYVVVVRSDGRLVVHQRSAWKDISPSAWDIAFGGLCGVGEGWALAATRELAEEAGLTGVTLEDLGGVEWTDGHASLIGRVFVAVHDGVLAPADGEVVALDEVRIPDLARWMSERPMVDDSPVVVTPLLQTWWAARTTHGQ